MNKIATTGWLLIEKFHFTARVKIQFDDLSNGVNCNKRLVKFWIKIGKKSESVFVIPNAVCLEVFLVFRSRQFLLTPLTAMWHDRMLHFALLARSAVLQAAMSHYTTRHTLYYHFCMEKMISRVISNYVLFFFPLPPSDARKSLKFNWRKYWRRSLRKMYLANECDW